MEDNKNLPENLYNNTVAVKDLIKMMKRKELITVSFVLDKYGYETIEVESKVIDKFLVQLSDDLFSMVFKYLLFGEIEESLPSPTENLIISPNKDTNEFSSDILKSFVADPKERPHMHIVPEIVDKPDRLTVTFAYPYGVIVFKVKRSKDMVEFLASHGF